MVLKLVNRSLFLTLFFGTDNENKVPLFGLSVSDTFVESVNLVCVSLGFKASGIELLNKGYFENIIKGLTEARSFAYASKAFPTGTILTWRGDNQNGHLPPNDSQRMATHRSRDPRMARWIITGTSSLLSLVYFRLKR